MLALRGIPVVRHGRAHQRRCFGLDGDDTFYGTIDVGQDFTLIDNGPFVVISPFVGINYWQETVDGFGARCNHDDVRGALCGPPGTVAVPFTTRVITNDQGWASIRLGAELKAKFWDRLTVRGDAAIVPGAYLWAEDSHYLRADLGTVPNIEDHGTGWGYQLEGEVRLLRNDRHAPRRGGTRLAREWTAVEYDLPALRPPCAGEQAQQRRLAGAVRPDDPDEAARRHVERDAANDRRLVVPECEVSGSQQRASISSRTFDSAGEPALASAGPRRISSAPASASSMPSSEPQSIASKSRRAALVAGTSLRCGCGNTRSFPTSPGSRYTMR